eukprot:gene9561-9725_t
MRADVQGGDIDCGQKDYQNAPKSYCEVCGGLKAIDDACRYEDPGCAGRLGQEHDKELGSTAETMATSSAVVHKAQEPLQQQPMSIEMGRGDNCGLHVIYSGTVGAAREAACKGIPAMALSLADHSARQQQHYDASAELSVPLIQAMLEALAAGAQPHRLAVEAGVVINVNFPAGMGCVFPKFLEVTEPSGPHLAEIEEHTPNIRMFRNYAGAVRVDDSEGSDNWAVSNSWVSVTPLSLRSDVPLRQAVSCPISQGAMSLSVDVVHGAASKAKLQAKGLPGSGRLGDEQLSYQQQ